MAEWDFWAIINPRSPRYPDWLRVFGPEAKLPGGHDIQVPIETPIGRPVQLPTGVRTCFFIKLEQLSLPQKERLIRFLGERFGAERAEIEARGVPLVDEDLHVVVLHPQKWFS